MTARKKPSEKREAGRPKEIAGEWKKVTVILRHDQLRRFNDIDVKQRRRDYLHAPLSRNEIIRAALDALFQSAIDIAEYTSEADLRVAIESRMGGKKS
jgi:hypothetical protein